MTSEMSTGKTFVVLAIVLGCFAVLWPKIFAPMLFQAPDKGVKPDRIPRPGPEFAHPALRAQHGRPIFPDEGRTVRRTIDKELRPGPVPGMRPSMGGPGPGMQPQLAQRGQGGPMSILMPLYTIGIVIFFVYTIMKIAFKKNDENDETTQAKLARKYRQLDANLISPLPEKNYQRMQQRYSRHGCQTNFNFQDIKDGPQSKEENPIEVLHATSSKVQDIKEQKEPGDSRDEEIQILKKRLEETERAMKLIIEQMGRTPRNEVSEVSVTSEATVTEELDVEEENSMTESVCDEEIAQKFDEDETKTKEIQIHSSDTFEDKIADVYVEEVNCDAKVRDENSCVNVS